MQASDGTGQRGHITPRHVWIDGPGPSTDRAPGVLMDWRTSEGKRECYCIWADGGGNVKPRAYFEWLPEERVKPRE